jgi:tetratricopeptide (TPR) repeat protein
VTPRDHRRRGIRAALIVWLALGCFAAGGAAAAPEGDPAMREASKHFQRGIALYGEADYRGALVEFKRAAALAPSNTVLYNIAETQYQLHDYASALKTFQQYLAAAGPNDSHRQEVESNVRVLQSRVGRLTITTAPPGADVTIDDQPVGRTPLGGPVIVNVGHVKVAASLANRFPATRYVEVAAEDNLAVSLELSAPPSAGGAPGGPPGLRGEAGPAPQQPSAGAPRLAGWITTGLLAAGALTAGALAFKTSQDLKSARDTFPTTSSHLDDLASKTRRYAIIADSLAVGALAIGALTLFYPWSHGEGSGSSVARVTVGPGSVGFETRW